MEPEQALVAGQTPRPGRRLQLALVFLLATAFSLLSSFPFAAFALVYGPNVAASIIQADASSLLWLLRSWELAFFVIFYELGKRFDFRGQYLALAALSLAGVLAGALPELLSVQTSSTTPSVVIGFAFEGVGLGNAISLFITFLTSVLQDFAFPFAGLALAFLREEYLRPALWPSAESGERRLLSKPVLALGVTITTMAYLASALTDVIGSRLPQTDQFAFLRSIFVVFSPYDSYASDFFYPMLFFIAFYFIGKRLDTRGGGMIAFAVSLYVAGTLGFLLGTPLAYYVRAFAATPSRPFPPFSFGLSFLADGAVRGFYVLALAFAAASLGFVRNMEDPINRDRLVAAALIAVALVLFLVSAFIAVSPG
jgi:hypothetical protein